MGQLGIPFRGHMDSGRFEPVSDIKDINTPQKIFEPYYSVILRETPNLPRTSENLLLMLKYLSPDIQNELITLIVEDILSSIFAEVKNASCFAVIADESTNKLIKSQLSIVVKYLKGDILIERCIGMINQSNLKGKL